MDTMRTLSRIPLCLCLLWFTLSPIQSALAWGPAVHAREGEATLQMLLSGPHADDWSDDALHPMALPYVRLGTLSPDFQWISDSLNFGHAKGLSYYLMDAAQDLTPEYRMFALGHLAHVLSDSAAETFFTPTVFASYPLGPFDLWLGQHDDQRAESESICEGFGDLKLGDWDAVVDMLYDFRLDGPEALDRFQVMVQWYCETGKAYSGSAVDCSAVLLELEETFIKADALLGTMSRALAKTWFQSLVDQEPQELVDLYVGGTFYNLVGQDSTVSQDYDYFYDLFVSGALFTEGPWQMYEDHFFDLGPTLTVDHLDLRHEGWPGYDGNAIKSGNLQSFLQFLPDDFSSRPELRVSELTWFNNQDLEVWSIKPTDDGAKFSATVLFFAALPFTGTVQVFVKKDGYGLDQSEDEVLGEASIPVDLDPRNYTAQGRTELTVSFTVDVESTDGVYLELWVAGDEGPWFTTSWDRIWSMGALELDRPIYRDNWGSYGHWPGSLAIETPDLEHGILIVKLEDFALGTALSGARVFVTEPEQNQGAASNGLALIDDLAWGDLEIHGTHTGYFDGAVETVTIEGNRPTWSELKLHPDPGASISEQEWITGKDCLNIFWKKARLEGRVSSIKLAAVTVLEDGSDEVLKEMETENNDGNHTLCFDANLVDGSEIVAEVSANYVNGLTGPASRSGGIAVDASPPEIVHEEVYIRDGADCSGSASQAGGIIPFVAALTISEPHSKIAKVEASLNGSEWAGVLYTSISGSEDGEFGYEFRPIVTGWTSVTDYKIRFTNGAGLETTRRLDGLPIRDDLGDCPGSFVVEPGGSTGGGCAGSGEPRLDISFILGIILLCRFTRRDYVQRSR